jgi:hypothetical protein
MLLTPPPVGKDLWRVGRRGGVKLEVSTRLSLETSRLSLPCVWRENAVNQ